MQTLVSGRVCGWASERVGMMVVLGLIGSSAGKGIWWWVGCRMHKEDVIVWRMRWTDGACLYVKEYIEMYVKL